MAAIDVSHFPALVQFLQCYATVYTDSLEGALVAFHVANGAAGLRQLRNDIARVIHAKYDSIVLEHLFDLLDWRYKETPAEAFELIVSYIDRTLPSSVISRLLSRIFGKA